MQKLSKATLYEEFGKLEKVEVDLPLTGLSNKELLKFKAKLGFPKYVDLKYFPMERAVATLWAAKNTKVLNLTFDSVFDKKNKIPDEPLNMSLFGGCAFKIHCPSSNKEGSPLNRNLHDVDLTIPNRDGRYIINLLLNLDKVFGTKYLHFVSHTDRQFNALRRGKRWRLRAIDEIKPDGTPISGVMDILVDKIEMRHTIDVREELENPEKYMHTIGLEKMILTKCQFIMDLPKERLSDLEEHGVDYRILPYEYNGKRLLLGMEEKDIKDICAAFLDHPFGNDPEKINKETIAEILNKDKKLRKTVRLNLENMVHSHDILKNIGIKEPDRTKITERIESLLTVIPEEKKRWKKSWWNIDVSTPDIFKG